MKKLSLLVSLILCVTIGGVYATWLYADKNDVYDESTNVGVSMSTAMSDGTYGKFTVTANFNILIEPLKVVDPDTTEPNANHKAAILFVDSQNNKVDKPQLTFTFKPNDSASTDIKANGIKAWYYLIDSTAEVENGKNFQYDSKDIFAYSATINNKVEISNWGTADADGKFTVVVDVLPVGGTPVIALTENFLLDTHAKYNTFNAALKGNSIVVNITDGVTTTETTGQN